MGMEGRENTKSFTEIMSETLFSVYDRLDSLGFLTPEILKRDIIDEVCGQLEKVEKLAEQRHDGARVEIFKALSVRFRSLNTVGVADNRDVFLDKAAYAFEMVEMVLLSIDGAVPQHKGKILSRIKAQRRYDE